MLSKLKKLFKIDLSRSMAVYSAIIYILAANIFFHRAIFNLYGTYMFKNTYIANIDTPTYGFYTYDVLREFNSYGQNKIISFIKPKFGRPVEIYEINEFVQQLYPNTLGMAYPRYESCKIYIRKGMDFVDFRETLIHEYLHCMGYEHNINRYDIMYYQLFPVDKDENIRQYADKVRKKFYE